MKPGSSTRLRIGRWNVSQNSTKRRNFCAPAASIAPPMCRQSFATTPTECPSTRARPVICDGP